MIPALGFRLLLKLRLCSENTSTRTRDSTKKEFRTAMDDIRKPIAVGKGKRLFQGE
jgi:hypothetical protein